MTDAPVRIQRKRTKGWRMPENTVYVGRHSVWGNPFVTGNAAEDVERYRGALCGGGTIGDRVQLEQYVAARKWTGRFDSTCPRGWLRGKNLACWCPLCNRHKDGKPFGDACADCPPCHADVLGELCLSGS